MSHFPSYRTAAQRDYTREVRRSPSISMQEIRREARVIEYERRALLDSLNEQLKFQQDFHSIANLRRRIIELHQQYR